MKNFNLVITVFVISVCSSFAQNDFIQITKKKGNKVVAIAEGKKIRLYTNDGRILHDYFTITEDTLIMISNQTFDISEVVRIRTKSQISKAVGVSCMGGGVFSGVIGISLISPILDGDSDLDDLLVGVIIGIPLVALGIISATAGVLFMTIGKNYFVKYFDYKIIKL